MMDLGELLRHDDPAYALLNWWCAKLDFDIWFVNLICAAIFTWGLVRFARRQPNPWLAIVVAMPYLVLVVAMGYTRQAVAIGFVLAGLSIVDRAPLWRFGLYVVAATTFHKSAIILLPLVGLASSRNRLTTTALLLVIGAMLYYLLVADAIDRMMTNYLESGYSSEGAGIRIAMNLPPALLFLRYRHYFGLQPEQLKIWTNFSYASFGAVLLLFTLSSSAAVDRLSLYLIPLQLFVLSRMPNVFQDRSGPNRQVVAMVIIYSALIQFVWLNFAQHAEYWVPYKVFPIGQDEDA
jgi:hypothetical protein